MDFLSRLAQPVPLLLDGATGTELYRRGVDTGLPLWSANALLSEAGVGILRQIHCDYLDAGADILTANTFRTHRRALAGTRHDPRALTRQAVAAAREAVEQFNLTPASIRRDLSTSPVLSPAEAGPTGEAIRAASPEMSFFAGGDAGVRYIAGSIAPLEDCYTPGRVPPDDECRAEHSERIHHLVESGVDLLLIETMNTLREAIIAARLAVITGLPTLVSFVCDAGGDILSGESLTAAASILMPLGVAGLGVNCGPAGALEQPLKELQAACGPDFPLVAYGNIGYADERVGWINTDAVEPETYAGYARTWPARIVGGCCGTTPDHIRRIAAQRARS
jgi:S-methylmethionine-dependent homocysteine/selenocysteine methylase